MKRPLFLIFLFLAGSFAFAQSPKLKMKKGQLLADGNAILLYARRNLATGIAFTSLDASQKLIDSQFCDNGTSGNHSDDYRHFGFPTLDLEIEVDKKYRLMELLEMLMEQGVLDRNGNFDADKARRFAAKFDIEAPISLTAAAKARRKERKKAKASKGHQ